MTNVVAADGSSHLPAVASIDVSFTVELAVGANGMTTVGWVFNQLTHALNSAVTCGSFEAALKSQIPEITSLDESKFEAPAGCVISTVNAATCGDKVRVNVNLKRSLVYPHGYLQRSPRPHFAPFPPAYR